MDRKTKFKRSAICVGVRFVRSARPGSFSSLRSAAFTASSIESTTERRPRTRQTRRCCRLNHYLKSLNHIAVSRDAMKK